MSSIPFLAPARAHARECTYNLFRDIRRPDFICAVPEDRPVPGFVDPDEWRFERPLRPLDMSPAGFENRAARLVCGSTGCTCFRSPTCARN